MKIMSENVQDSKLILVNITNSKLLLQVFTLEI